MVTPKVGEIYTPENTEELREAMLDHHRLLMLQRDPDVEPAIGAGSEPYIKYTVIANALAPALANIRIASKQTSELTAEGIELDQIREALGLPEISPSSASGYLVVSVTGGGSVLVPDDLEFTTSSGLRGVVYTGATVSDGDSVFVQMVDTGEQSNLEAGTEVTWTDPPLNLDSTATVDDNGLTGGLDEETDARKRERILNRRQNPVAGGSWAHVREIALNASGTIDNAYVYSAVSGPGTMKVVVTKSMDLESDPLDLTRAVSQSVLDAVDDAIAAELPLLGHYVVQNAAEVETAVVLKLDLPTADSNETGWVNLVPWPPLESQDFVRVDAVADSQTITINANTSIEPTDGVTEIAWYSKEKGQFVSATITAHSGSAGAWVLELSDPLELDGDSVGVSDLICPNAYSLNDYAATLLEYFNTFGPGEQTEDEDLLPRAERKPTTGVSEINIRFLSALIEAHEEIEDAEYSSITQSEPAIPATVANAPEILVPGNLAFYPLD